MMPRFHMGALCPPDDTAADMAVEWCLKSDELTERALDWASDHAAEHAGLVEKIIDCYVESPQFDTWVQDVADGAL